MQCATLNILITSKNGWNLIYLGDVEVGMGVFEVCQCEHNVMDAVIEGTSLFKGNLFKIVIDNTPKIHLPSFILKRVYF